MYQKGVDILFALFKLKKTGIIVFIMIFLNFKSHNKLTDLKSI